MRFSGFEEFQRHLSDLTKAFGDINGTIGQIHLRSSDPEDVSQAIAEMEAAVDARAAAHAGNPDVRKIMNAAKQKYAEAIRQRANDLSQASNASAEESAPPSIESQAIDPLEERQKVFLSHSHADKDTIVRPLDRLLRDVHGIQTWLDERDMPAGADMIDAIFSQGIGGADAVVVVLTPTSIQSRWVHEELNVSVVRKIKQRVKSIIPVVYGISDDDVPDPLVATNWIRLTDLSEPQLAVCAQRIGEALYGIMPAPVAPAPPYAGIAIHRLPSLKPNDERIFAEACREYVDRDYWHPAVGVDTMIAYGKSIGLLPDTVVESLHALEQQHYISELQYYLGSGNVPDHFRISDYGLEHYLRSYRASEYKIAKGMVLSAIVNSGCYDLRMIISDTGVREPLVHHIFEQIERNGHGRIVWHSEGGSIMPEPTLKRLLED